MAIDTEGIKIWVSENIRDISTIDDVTAALNVCPETLRREFARKERVPVSTFIARMKVEKMKELLLTTDMKCFEIAYDLKFSREDVAARFFKRMTGMTMLEFRAKHGNGRDNGNLQKET